MKESPKPNISPLEAEIENKLSTALLYSALSKTLNQKFYKSPPDAANSETNLWHPEWRDFNIKFTNGVYILFENGEKVHHSISLESLKWELMERAYFKYKK